MSVKRSSYSDPEKRGSPTAEPTGQYNYDGHDVGMVQAEEGKLHKNLKGRHMQMIAM
jgi:amino acid permease